MNNIKLNYLLNNNYKDLINKDIYELVILDIMNLSKIVFPGTYRHIDIQSNGESDFVSIDNGELLDAKIIFPKKQCENLSLNNLEYFYKTIIMETNDIFDAIMTQNNNISSTILYKEIKSAFDKIINNENIIIFIPFQFTLELENSLSSKLGSDIFTQITSSLKKKKARFFEEHKIYFIYPNIENKIILKNITTREFEYLKSDLLAKYIYVEF